MRSGIHLIHFCKGSNLFMDVVGDRTNFMKKREMQKEKIQQRYVQKRLLKGKLQSIPFYLFKLFPVNQKKIVFCCIEGTTGYTCNPKYIAREFIRREKGRTGCNLVWLVNDTSKKFPKEIKVVKNTLLNRAYHLSTAKVWVDNSRKPLECRKRKGQVYIQTWHAKIGFKPTCLDRGKSFSKIAYLVSRHDSDMADYWLSNSDWYDKTLSTGSLYNGKILRTGSPRCDILVNGRKKQHIKVRKAYGLPKDVNIIMHAPTFRGGNQSTRRAVHADTGTLDYDKLVTELENKFGGKWYIFLRLHPQLVAGRTVCKMQDKAADGRIIDVSREDDMYRLLAGCDAFVTDYSSAAFDAAVMEIPVFLYCDDYKEYQKERGKLLWDLKVIPFGFAQDNDEMRIEIERFDVDRYRSELQDFFRLTGMTEDGKASKRVVDFIEKIIEG